MMMPLINNDEVCNVRERIEENLNEKKYFSILAQNINISDWIDVFYIDPKKQNVIHSYKTVLGAGKKVHIEYAKKYKKLVIQRKDDGSISLAFILSGERKEKQIFLNVLITGKIVKVN